MPAPKKNCPECGEEFYAFHLPGHRLREHGIEHVKASAPPAGEAKEGRSSPSPQETKDPAGGGEHPPGTAEPVDETPPRKPGLMDRIRSRRGRGRGGQHPSPASGERPPRRPRPRFKRVPLDTDISDVWAFGGRRLERTAHYPTGRMLQYQAPAAGVILDRAFAGTLPDRILFQPIARNRDKYEDVAFLLAGPLLTFSITTTIHQMQEAVEDQDMERYNDLSGKLEMQREMFTWCLSMMLPRLAAGAKQAREKKAKEDAAIAEAFPELGDEDPVTVLGDMLFAPPHFEEASQNGKPDPTAAAPSPEGAVPFGG